MPATNITVEPEMYAMAPEGVTIHTGRLLVESKVNEKAIERISMAKVNVIAYACTAVIF